MAPRQALTGFTTVEVEKLQGLLKDTDFQSLNADLFKKIAKGFNRSRGRVKKSHVKWTEVQNLFQTRQEEDENDTDGDVSNEIFRLVREACLGDGSTSNGANEFEAKSKTDGAWYDVARFVRYRELDSLDAKFKVLVRFSGYEEDCDEWVEVKNGLRQKSIGLAASQCNLVNIGDNPLYYLIQGKARRYFEASILGIERRAHNSRSCGCTFTIRFILDNRELVEKEVKLRSLYFQPSILLDS